MNRDRKALDYAVKAEQARLALRCIADLRRRNRAMPTGPQSPRRADDLRGLTDPTVQALTLCRQVIVSRGWCQGDLFGPRGEVCIVGALRTIPEFDPYLWDIYPAIGRAIGVEIKIGEHGDLKPIVDWNDAPGRTRADVLALYDRAIELRLANLSAANDQQWAIK